MTWHIMRLCYIRVESLEYLRSEYHAMSIVDKVHAGLGILLTGRGIGRLDQ